MKTYLPSQDTILTLDIGSSSIRAMLFDFDAKPILGAVASREHFFDHPQPGASESDARTLRGFVETCIDDLLMHPRAIRIAAVATASMADTLVGLDERGTPVTPVYTYADTRAAETLPDLRAKLDAEALHQRTGAVLHPAHKPARLYWLKQTQPGLFEQVVSWVDFPTYLYRAWFAESRTSYSLAAWSGLLNRSSLQWDSEILDLLGVPLTALSTLADYTDSLSGLRGAYRTRWEALADVPFLLAVGDGAAANIGAGAVGHDRIALTVGTTAALRKVIQEDPSPEAALPKGLFGYRVDAAHHLIGGATTEGGSIYAWARDTLVLPEDCEAQLAERSVDAHGLTFLPLLAGERSPGYALDATGSVAGLRLGTSPLDILQAALEGVALRLSLILDLLDPEGEASIYAGGGAIRQSAAWTQIIADALNRPLYITQTDEVTARGVALLALSALTVNSLDTVRDLYPVPTRDLIEPRPDSAATLRLARDRQTTLYAKLVANA